MGCIREWVATSKRVAYGRHVEEPVPAARTYGRDRPFIRKLAQLAIVERLTVVIVEVVPLGERRRTSTVSEPEPADLRRECYRLW